MAIRRSPRVAVCLYAVVFALALFCQPAHAQYGPTITLDLSGDWRYASVSDTDSGPWGRLNVPGNLPIVAGEYSLRKRFDVPQGEANQRTWVLDVGSIGGKASLLLNGRQVAESVGDGIPGRYALPVHDGVNKLELIVDTRVDSRSTFPVRPVGLTPNWPTGGIGKLVVTGASGPAVLAVQSRLAGETVTVQIELASPFSVAEASGNLDLSDANGALIASAPFAAAMQRGKGTTMVSFAAPPAYWSPDAPQRYYLRVRMGGLDSSALGSTFTAPLSNSHLSVSADGRLLLNGQVFQMRGTMMVPRAKAWRRDLFAVKRLGANTVRIIGAPSEDELALCDSLAIAALLELPVQNTPENVLTRDEFQQAAEGYLNRILGLASKHPCVIAIGLGDANNDATAGGQAFYERLYKRVHGSYPCYYVTRNPRSARALDIAALSVFGENDSRIASTEIERFAGLFQGRKPVILAGAGSVTSPGDHSGIANPYSLEAQARVLLDEFNASKGLAGFFAGSIADYRGARANSLSDEADHYVVASGLLDSTGAERPAYEQIRAAFHDEHSTATLHSGEATSEAPLGYLLYDFALILLFFLLMNVDRRFREYVSRAIVRPFNFFADVRDQRLIPNVDSTLLAIIIAGAWALFCGSLIHGYRLSYDANWMVGIFTWKGLQAWLAKMSWDYVSMVVWLTLGFLAVIVLIALILRFAAIFIRGRIFLADTYNITVWALLPSVFILAYDLILPRMDMDSVTITVSLIVLVVFKLWMIYRLLKGAGVLFDIYPTRLYLYGTLILAALVLIVAFYMDYRTNISANFSFIRSVMRSAELTP